MPKYDVRSIKGVIPALITCFDENEQIDEKRMRNLTEHLIDEGVDGLYLTGSTGETFLMTMEERKKVVEIVINQADGRVPIIVHIGDIGTLKSIELAKHAQDFGADAISSVPPFYWKFNEEDVYNYYKDITESVEIPMIVYNIPLAGLMGYSMIEKLATLPNVKGIKYTASTHFEITKIKKDMGEDFMVYSGADEMACSGLLAGADGIIGSFYNVIPDVFIGINEALKNNDAKKAAILQAEANEIILYCVKYDYIPLMKRMSAWAGLDAGYSRRPFKRFSQEEEAKLKSDIISLRDKRSIASMKVVNNIK